jgi:tetratricopeptide (TPR) repeat protein
MMVLVVIAAIKVVKRSAGFDPVFAGLVAVWIAYQAQSIISIDNIGISIWGWVLGGAIIGMSVRENSKADQNTKGGRKKTSISLAQPTISMGSTILAIILISSLYRVEANMFDTRNRFNPQAPQLKQELYKYSNKTLESRLLDPNYKINVGAYLIEAGFPTEGVKALKEVHIYDSRNLDALFYLAEFYQKTGNFAEAINYRIKIIDLDPWNSYNYLQLGRMYKLNGDFTSMQKMLESIEDFDSVSTESKLASTELTIS